MVSYVVYKDKLKGEYLHAFDQVETYSVVIEMSESVREEMLAELLDTLYEAQENGKPVQRIIGADVEQFCKNYFQDYSHMDNFLKSLPALFFRLAFIVLVFSILDIATAEDLGVSFMRATTDLGGVVLGGTVGIMASIIISAIAKVLLFRWKRFTNAVYSWMTIGIVVVSIVLVIVFCPDVVITVPLFPAILISGGYVLIYRLVQYGYRYRKYGSIKKPEAVSYGFKESMKEVWNSESIDNQTELLKTMVRGYEKKNARLLKRGKEVVTPEEFTEKVRKENQMMKHEPIFLIAMFSIIVAGSLMATNYETIFDFFIYLLIMLVTEGAICWFFCKAVKAGYKERTALIARCDELGITMPQLWEQMQQGEEIETVGEGEESQSMIDWENANEEVDV